MQLETVWCFRSYIVGDSILILVPYVLYDCMYFRFWVILAGSALLTVLVLLVSYAVCRYRKPGCAGVCVCVCVCVCVSG